MSNPQYGPPGGYNAPPGGGNYYQPPKSNSGGCWKAFGITCGLLVLGVIILGVIAGNAIRKEMAHPTKGSIFGAGVELGQAQKNGIAIVQAIQRYHTHTGKYPDNLKDLVPEYLTDATILHSDMDADSTDSTHISYKYIKPGSDAAGDTPVLTYHYRMDIKMAGQEQSSDGTIVFNLDGTTNTSTSHQNGGHVQFRSGE